ncbi:hypothetical protein MAPG_09982 [Magnaporthiopsis poae ATCC 64411]|uniref:CFEM domain-containing protein n=1 Tax=Magnaporthiopsis poae (strain ATCC 64411 / 73-15) TaxID=644358 RepID=A0A0C4EBD4_MAGP6|nr:hypothetical protein MAPG_09982 [Magnaporthiopsis poae ATCC 64411]
MRSPLTAAATLLLLSAVVPAAAQDHTNSTAPTTPSSPLAALPACAAACLKTAVAQSPCAPTDQACICTNEKLQAQATVCITGSCPIKQTLFVANITATTCGFPVRDRRDQLSALAITLGTLSGVFVALRVAARLLIIGGPMGADDWCVVAALLVGIPDTVMIVHGAIGSGLGLDVWTVPPSNITDFGRWFFIIEIFYFTLVSMTKMALLLFYLRIFPARGIRRLLWGTVAFNAVFGLASVLIGVLQCRPVRFFWEKWDGEHTGTCLDLNAIAWGNAAVSIALDFWMLALPLSQLRNLKLHWKKKIGVGLMFGVGTFVTVVSILRLQSMVEFASTINPTWDHWDLTKWSTIEINVAIMCACLPSLRLLLVRMFPLLHGTTARYGSKPDYKEPSRGVSRPATAAGLVADAMELGNTSPGSGAKKEYKHGRQPSQGATRELGVQSTVDRGSLDDDVATVKGGITYSRSYEVSYGEQDEESFVGAGSEGRPGTDRSESRERERERPGEGERGGGGGAGAHGYHRRFHTSSSSKSSLQSPPVEKIPENVI